jgi:hypothetical protein
VPKKPAKVDGDNVLYHYLQKDLYESDVWLFQMLAARLVSSLGIWFSTSTYQALPVILPFAVRDPTCRKRGEDDAEEWGAPDARGYFRDDNSLIKNLPSALTIRSPRKIYNAHRLGNGFVAAHVWRELSDSTVGADLSSRDPWTNSFVPNLVWLPRQVAKLTDREGSFTQQYLQAVAWKTYRSLPVEGALKDAVDRIWLMLPEPTAIPAQALPSVAELSFFDTTERFLTARLNAIDSVVEALGTLQDEGPMDRKVISSRYSEGLKNLPDRARSELGSVLRVYAAEARIGVSLLALDS